MYKGDTILEDLDIQAFLWFLFLLDSANRCMNCEGEYR